MKGYTYNPRYFVIIVQNRNNRQIVPVRLNRAREFLSCNIHTSAWYQMLIKKLIQEKTEHQISKSRLRVICVPWIINNLIVIILSLKSRHSIPTRCVRCVYPGEIKKSGDERGMNAGREDGRRWRWGHESTESSPRQYFAAWSDKRGHNAEGRIDSPRSGEEDRGEDRAGYVARETLPRRDGPGTLLPKRCSPSGLGKQRATGLPRGVINHFLLRKER